MKRLALLGLFLFAAVAQAVPLSLLEVPTNWRLQDYVPDGINVYFTGVPSTSNCGSSGLVLSGASVNDANRFWSLVMAAKTANKLVFVYYTPNATANGSPCVINSFGWAENQ